MKNKKEGIGCIFLAISLVSCTLHPQYKREAVQAPQEWKVNFPDSIDGLQTESFWMLFQDPVLDQLVQQALKENQDLKAAIETVTIFLARYGVVRSKLFPQLDGGAQGTREKIPKDIVGLFAGDGQQIGNAFDLMFNASYLIDFWGEVRSASESSYHLYLASIQSRRSVVLSLVSSVMTTYFLLRQYDKQLDIAKETITAREESYRLAQIRYHLGLTSKLQVEQALAELEFARLEQENLSILVAETEDLMAVLIGQSTEPIPRGLEIDQLNVPEQIVQDIPSTVVNQRPDLLEKEQKLIAANADIGVAKARFFPQFNLSGSIGLESNQLSTLFRRSSNIWDYGLAIIQEIFTGGKLTAQLRETEAEKRRSLYEYHGAILNAFKEANDALVRHHYRLESKKTQKIRVDALERYLKISCLQYNEGQIDYLTYLDAERHLFEAELSQVGTIADVLISFVQIYQAMGGNWVEKADQIALQNPINPAQ